jgi:hypothetical protein
MPTTKEAQWGERMIKLEVRFYTNNLAKGNGRVRPKHAWAAGAVTLAANPTHGIAAGSPVQFHSLLDLPVAIERVLTKRGIRLHAGRTMKKYWAR